MGEAGDAANDHHNEDKQTAREEPYDHFFVVFHFYWLKPQV